MDCHMPVVSVLNDNDIVVLGGLNNTVKMWKEDVFFLDTSCDEGYAAGYDIFQSYRFDRAVQIVPEHIVAIILPIDYDTDSQNNGSCCFAAEFSTDTGEVTIL